MGGGRIPARHDDLGFRLTYGVAIDREEAEMKDLKQQEIRELALFRACRPDEARWIGRVADTLDVPAGRTLVREGQTVREFVVIVRGSAVAADGDGEILLAPGAFFGELGLVDGQPHRWTVETVTPVRLLVFDPRAFRGMLERVPTVGRKLLHDLVGRLRVANDDRDRLRAAS